MGLARVLRIYTLRAGLISAMAFEVFSIRPLLFSKEFVFQRRKTTQVHLLVIDRVNALAFRT
jgi:hypothetical protein